MNKLLLPFAVLLLASACGNDTKKPAADTTAKNTVSDTVPHEIIGGKKSKVGTWAYPLDSSMNSIYIGNADSLKKIIIELADTEYLKDKKRETIRLINRRQTELLTISICRTAKNDWVPYSLTLAKYNPSNLSPGRKPVMLDDYNYYTSNKAYIGYTEDFFLSLLSEQPLTTWSKGDTVYYTHQAQPKDASRLKHWKPEDYKGSYKFVDGILQEISLYVKPEVFEAGK
jgi:hypothetical protein